MQEERRRVPGVAGGHVVQVVQEPSLFRNTFVFARCGISVPSHRILNPIQKLPVGDHVFIAVGSDFYQCGTIP